MRWFLLMLALVGPVNAQETVIAAGTIRGSSLIGPADVAVVDGATPGALSDMSQAIGMEARINLYPGRPIRPGDLWSDDPADPAYNLKVRAPHPFSHEHLRRADPLYDIVLLTDWNWPDAVQGHGSAIFLHQWRRPGFPTAGCVAFRRDHLRRIATMIAPGARLVVR